MADKASRTHHQARDLERLALAVDQAISEERWKRWLSEALVYATVGWRVDKAIVESAAAGEALPLPPLPVHGPYLDLP